VNKATPTNHGRRPLTARVLLALLCALGAPQALAPAAEQKLLAIEDLYRCDSVTEFVVAPHGQSAVYCRLWIDRPRRVYRHALWRVEGRADNRRPMEDGQPDGRRPMYSADGKWIVFLSTRPLPDGKAAFTPVPPYSDPATDIWLIPSTGGKAIPLGGPGKPYGRVFSDRFYGRIAFSPDGKRLVFVADDGRDRRQPQEAANGVRIRR